MVHTNINRGRRIRKLLVLLTAELVELGKATPLLQKRYYQDLRHGRARELVGMRGERIDIVGCGYLGLEIVCRNLPDMLLPPRYPIDRQ